MKDYFVEMIWLAGATAIAWLAPRTFLTIQAAALLITISLRLLERKMGAAGRAPAADQL